DAPIEAVLRALAERDRVALAELLVGPRARVDGGMTREALKVVDLLERAIAPSALYRRLADISADAHLDVLGTAVERHPDADWLVGLSARIEGPWAGLTHLRASANRASFQDVCRAYARRGARAALIRLVEESGASEPLVAFVEMDDRESLVAGAAALLGHHPDVPTVALLAALWGPVLDPLLKDVIESLETETALQALARQARAHPGAAARLAQRLATT
ncbi:MAG: hypothetical protein VX000_02450, partial [Myxococcota bacterium]|nr:hypothetical protein [Myxococcota bacterium]